MKKSNPFSWSCTRSFHMNIIDFPNMDHIYIKYLIISPLSLKLITVVTCMFSDSVMTTVSEVGVRGWGCSGCRGLETFFLGGGGERGGRRGVAI